MPICLNIAYDCHSAAAAEAKLRSVIESISHRLLQKELADHCIML